MLRWLSVIPVGMVVLACGSSSGTSADPNCSPGSNCSSCQNCLELCQCTTNNSPQCPAACGVTGSGGGSAGGGGYTSGGGGGGSGGLFSGGGGGGGTPPSGGAGGTPAGDLATGVAISQLDIMQGVKVPLMQGGNLVTNAPAPVVSDREALIRVYVTPDSSFQARSIVARVDLGGSAAGSFEGNAAINGPSSEANTGSTINVDIPGANIKQDTTFSVSLHEATPGQTFPGSNAGASWPTGGPASLGAKSSNGNFNVVLVPVIVNGITPDTSASRVQAYHDRLLQMYPVPDVNITVHAPATYTGPAPQALSTSGWNNLLNWMMQLHANEGSTAFYYGVFTPTQSFSQFCGGACIAGLSSTPTNQPGDVVGRTGTGLGFFPSGGNPTSADTMTHEVGHTCGLLHAPCQTQDYDPSYPYSGASIGTWGWDMLSKQFKSPSQYVDMMSYCDPTWVADWTFNKLFNRISYANATADYQAPSDPARAPGTFETAIIRDDGTLEWGTPIDSPWPVLGDAKQVELLAPSGAVIGKVTGFFYPVDHGQGGLLLLKKSALALEPATASIKPVGMSAVLGL